MRYSTLQQLFNGSVNPEKFKAEIGEEVFQYRKKMATKGTSIAININEDSSLYFSRDNLIKLCGFQIDHIFTSTEISYIADCLTLSDSVHYENEEVEEFLEEIIELETMGKLDEERMLSIIERIE